MSEKVRIGVIGVGGMAGGHIHNITTGKAGDRCEITAVCDTNEERLAWVKDRFSLEAESFTSAEDMIRSGKVDALLVATPHFFHPDLAILGFKHGLHVLIEKPAGVHTKHVREMNAAAKASGKVFAIMFNQRIKPFYQKLKDLVDSGDLGEIKRVQWVITNWYRSQSYYDSGTWRATWAGEGGGVLLNQCPHQLDIWQWCFGLPEEVTAYCQFGKYHDIEVEDDVTAYMKYKEGYSATFIASTGETPGTNRLEIACDMGKLVAENDTLIFWRNRKSERKFNAEFKGGFGSPECWKCEIPLKTDAAAHEKIVENFVNAILDGEELIAPGEEGLNSLMLSNAMLLSQWRGNQAVKLSLDDEEFHNLLQKNIDASKAKK
ncbi:MAG: Gfo/Idh/MocA family oxidoreductase [Phycisphaerae bacterium]|nr:Gfo/Idh/MocA family oxidoreductase [Phycisphaerae bacterium]